MSDIAVTRDIIPLSEPEISGNEWTYIKECLDTGWVSSAGCYVDMFERRVADYVGTKYAVATVNGTSALHISLISCGVQSEDEVIVPTLTFIAPVNVVRYCGAYPVFLDCNMNNPCMDTQKTSDFINNECEQRKDGYTYNKKTGRRIKAIIPVHIFGHPVDMDSLLDICEKANIEIIEDAAESLGSEYKGKMTGSFGTFGCFSFNGNKIITTGGGGMIATDDEALAKRARHLTTQAKSDPFEYNHDEIGYNYRLTNIQAAMGIAQIERIKDFIEIKRRNAVLYRDLLSDIEEIRFLWERPWERNNFWFYTIEVLRGDKSPLIEYLLSRDIQIRAVWKLIHTMPMYKECQTYFIENAFRYYENCINLPCSVSIKKEEIEYVVESIKSFYD
ncbi:MAG: LegC family aminotransferase [Nitrospirota bacterium]